MFLKTGWVMTHPGDIPRGCYAARLGECSGPLNREHFISKNLLKDFEKGNGSYVAGYLHSNRAGTILMSAESMSAKELCEGHNSRLSNVDVEGSRFLLAFLSAHVGLLEEMFTTDQTYEFDGPLIERWMRNTRAASSPRAKPESVRNASKGLLLP